MRAVQDRQLARSGAATLARAVCLGLVAANLLCAPVKAQDLTSVQAEQAPSLSSSHSSAAGVLAQHSKHADFQENTAPGDVKQFADWVIDSGNNQSLPFVIIHKPGAKVFVFDKDGHLKGTAWALVGLTPGDDSVSGIGTMPLSAINPEMRTTPAGRFVSTLGRDLGKFDVLWVHYQDAISLHRVINTNPAERRLERIVSPVPRDHRISYGCINVPANFFDAVVDPTFKGTSGIVYILPEVKTLQEVFPGYYDVNAGSRTLVADVPAPAPQ